MGTIDVSDVLEDPDFQDSFQLIRQSETVDVHGRAVDTPGTTVELTGVVQPASGETMQIIPEATRSVGMIEIWTQYNVQGETDTDAPDLIVWQGKHYIVSRTDPWTNWGVGWVHAVCVRRELTPQTVPL